MQTGQRLRLLLPRTDEGVGPEVFQRPAPQRGCRGDPLHKETIVALGLERLRAHLI